MSSSVKTSAIKTSAIKTQVNSAVKDAMRTKDKKRLLVLRMVMSEFKRIEVDERIELDDDRVLQVLDKLVKQRRESIKQYDEAGRSDLADAERAEISVIETFLPAPLSEDEIKEIVSQAVLSSKAESIRDMGKVMNLVKPQVVGRADMGIISKRVKESLA